MASQLLNLKKQLLWSDFGIPVNKPAPSPGKTATAALTRTNYVYSANAEPVPGTNPPRYRLNDDVRITIQFQRPPSWVASWVFNTSLQEQNRILHHEQGHYDLVALLVRDMFIDIMQLKQNTYSTAQAVMNEINHIKQRYDSKTQPVQDHYDVNTNHGNTQSQQAVWDGFIQKAFTQQRNPPMNALDGTPYKIPLLTVLQQAGINP
jgi:Bacterial protein of unknown function (DUF922)